MRNKTPLATYERSPSILSNSKVTRNKQASLLKHSFGDAKKGRVSDLKPPP